MFTLTSLKSDDKFKKKKLCMSTSLLLPYICGKVFLAWKMWIISWYCTIVLYQHPYTAEVWWWKHTWVKLDTFNTNPVTYIKIRKLHIIQTHKTITTCLSFSVREATQSCTDTVQPHTSLTMNLTLPLCGEMWHAHQDPVCASLHTLKSEYVSPCFRS